MKPQILTLLFTFFIYRYANAQDIQIDLSQKKSAPTNNVDIKTKTVKLINRSKSATYKLQWNAKTSNKGLIPPFQTSQLSSNDFDFKKCSKDIQAIVDILDNATDEAKIKKAVDDGKALIGKNSPDDCTAALQRAINETEKDETIPFTVKYNQEITLKVQKFDKAGTKLLEEWTYTLNTEEHTRWLTHYGLTYAPSVISKVDHFYSQDSSVANTYRIAKQNNNGPKAWDNISATINFTYPFLDVPNYPVGFTAGFGLNPSLQLSGHAGLSAIIGTNVILGTGIAFMQKQRLRGEFHENQIIKTNLAFDALHEKVWLPELYFTIGFRFDKNPFGGSTDKKASDKPTSTAPTSNQ